MKIISRYKIDQWRKFKKFPEVSKLVEEIELFDWKEHNAAKNFKERWKRRGHAVIDLGRQTDSYVFVVIKKGVKVR